MTRARMTEIKQISHDKSNAAQNEILGAASEMTKLGAMDTIVILCAIIDELAAQVPITEG